MKLGAAPSARGSPMKKSFVLRNSKAGSSAVGKAIRLRQLPILVRRAAAAPLRRCSRACSDHGSDDASRNFIARIQTVSIAQCQCAVARMQVSNADRDSRSCCVVTRSPAFPRVITCVIQVRYERGVYLPEQDLWLDPWDAKPLAFVSHAHSDHIAPHEEIIVSERTARLMQARMPGERHEHVVPFGQPTNVARPRRHAAARGPHLRLGAILSRNRRRLAALHRRFQAAPRPLRGTDRMAPGRHADHGDDLRPAALSPAADRRSHRADRRLLPRRAGGKRGAGAARLLVRQSAGDSLRARRRRA